MALRHRGTRRAAYRGRRHELETRPRVQADDGQIVWWRGPEGDHAFPVTTGYLRSKCKAVRWDTTMQRVEGTVKPCLDCLRLVAPPASAAAAPVLTESELRLLDGNR